MGFRIWLLRKSVIFAQFVIFATRYQKLVWTKFIRFSLAGVLLLLFALSNTPKKIIHDFLASHKDKTAYSANTGLINLNKAGYNCKCDHIVVESPFTGQDNRIEWLSFQNFPQHSDKVIHSFCSPGFFFFELRGPPISS